MKIFVGNLSFAATEADVKELFEGFGSVVSVVIVKEKKELSLGDLVLWRCFLIKKHKLP